MASIFKRKSKDGKKLALHVVVRLKGYPALCKTFERKHEAEDWAQDAERQIKLGIYKNQHTYKELIERLHTDGALDHLRSFKSTKSQFTYWEKRLGSYALIHITPELISKEKQILIDTPTEKGLKRSPGTINRYLAVLSSTLSRATKRLHWLSENPCANMLKLKADPGRDRILSKDEISQLLDACRKSKSHYL